MHSGEEMIITDKNCLTIVVRFACLRGLRSGLFLMLNSSLSRQRHNIGHIEIAKTN
jgi:hypothetical protein